VIGIELLLKNARTVLPLGAELHANYSILVVF